jgi:ribonucleotide monophosphatase NagD (HAD superfamily)
MNRTLTDKEATVLENCSIKEYLTFFTNAPTMKAKQANEVLREASLQDLKELMLRRIKLTSEILKNYSGAKKAKIIGLDYEIEQRAKNLKAVTLQEYNSYVVSVFRAANQKIDKSISMLDFFNLESQVYDEYKTRLLNESKK